MEAAEFQRLVGTWRDSPAVAAKADIGHVAERLGLNGADIAVGDDCAALRDGDGHLLLAIEGFLNGFVEADPWFAGWCGVMVNLSDIAAMGGRPLAIVDALWANGDSKADLVLDGLRAAARAYGVPIVGGHTNLRNAHSQLAVAALGRAGPNLLTSFDAAPGDVLVLAADHRGAYREPFDNFQAALEAPHERLRADLAVLAEIADTGVARAAKDVSQAGLVGTAIMLAESSGVGIDIDLDSIVCPPGVALERWLKTFPSYGFLISVAPGALNAALARFRDRGLEAGAVGQVRAGSEVALISGERRAVLRDHATDRLMGLSR